MISLHFNFPSSIGYVALNIQACIDACMYVCMQKNRPSFNLVMFCASMWRGKIKVEANFKFSSIYACVLILVSVRPGQKMYIMICGDTNKFDIRDSYSDYADLNQLVSPPTRGTECLDIAVTNFNQEILTNYTLPPLSSQEEIYSDHLILVAECRLKHKHSFKWVEYTTKEVSQDGIL